MMIASADLAAPQLGQLSEEELHVLLSNHPSESTIAFTPVDTVDTVDTVLIPTSVHAHATHMYLPNIPAGGSLSAMASESRCRQLAITDHFSHGARHSSSTTPRATSRHVTIIPGTFVGFRS
jgi:hypothetical protein